MSWLITFVTLIGVVALAYLIQWFFKGMMDFSFGDFTNAAKFFGICFILIIGLFLYLVHAVVYSHLNHVPVELFGRCL